MRRTSPSVSRGAGRAPCCSRTRRTRHSRLASGQGGGPRTRANGGKSTSAPRSPERPTRVSRGTREARTRYGAKQICPRALRRPPQATPGPICRPARGRGRDAHLYTTTATRAQDRSPRWTAGTLTSWLGSFLRCHLPNMAGDPGADLEDAHHAQRLLLAAGARSHLTYDLGELYIGRRALFGCRPPPPSPSARPPRPCSRCEWLGSKARSLNLP